MGRRSLVIVVATFALAVVTCRAQVADVPVIKDGSATTVMDLSGFRSGTGEAATFTTTLEQDLTRSGWFTLVRTGRGTVVLRGTASAAGGQVSVSCSVANVATGRSYLNRSYSEPAAAARRLAHRVADDIVKAVKGIEGMASTQIVMIGSQGGRKHVYICDYDGQNMVKLTQEGAVCLSPSWGPQGDRVVYTSFHQGFPDIYMIDLVSKRRQRVAAFPGLNSGAEISPDGNRMVLTLSKDGNPDLYIMDLKGRKLSRITKTRRAAEGNPTWSPDGSRIAYVSNTSGRPHLYMVSARGGSPRRITFQGNENVAPDWGPNGQIVYASRREGRYHICLLDPVSRQEVRLTSEYVDHEEPSWAPDGRHVVFTRTQRYQSDVYILDTINRTSVRLTTLQGDWYSPDWSPR